MAQTHRAPGSATAEGSEGLHEESNATAIGSAERRKPRGRPITVTFFKDQRAKSLTTEQLSLEELRDRVLNTSAHSREQLPWLKLATFGDKRSDKGSLRHDANVVAISGVEIDYDDRRVSFEDAAEALRDHNLAALIYTSPSFKRDAPRWRVLCPTSRELAAAEREKLVARVNGVLGGIVAPETFTLSQSYYFGSIRNNPDHRADVIEGEFIDLRDDLDVGAIQKRRTESADNPFSAHGNGHAAPIDVEARLSAMRHKGEGDSAIHLTQLSVSASMLSAGHGVDHVVASLLNATKVAAGDDGANWNWKKEEHAIRGMCDDWLRKHPEVVSLKSATKAKPDAEKNVVLVRASDVVMRAKDWVWEGHLLRGAQELLTGLPGLGKSQVQIHLVACLTTGRHWPDGSPCARTASVIMLTAEDTRDDEVVPRLVAAGADLTRVHILDCIKTDERKRQFLLGDDLDDLERAVAKIGDVGLVTIDPITAYMGGTLDSHKATQVRSQLGPLKDFAERTNVAVSTITHPAKNPGHKAIDHYIGSQAFIAAGRIGHVCIQEIEVNGEGVNAPTGRVLFANAKNNAHKTMGTLAFRIEETILQSREHGMIAAPRVVWDAAPVNITADEAVAASAGNGREDRQADQRNLMVLLMDAVKDGPVPVTEVEEKAEALGFTKRQVRRARDKLGKNLKTEKDGDHWVLMRG